MCYFVVMEMKCYFNFVVFFQEFYYVVYFDVIVMCVGVWVEFDFFDLNDGLFFLCFGFMFLLFIFEFIIVYDFVDWWIGVG